MTSTPDSRRISNLTSLSLQERLNQQEDELSATINDADQVDHDYSDVSSSRFRTSARSDKDINVYRPVIRQGERPVISKDLQKLREVAVSKLTNSFCLLALEDSDSQLANTYDTTMRVIEFKRRLSKFDMLDVFHLRSSFSSSSRDLFSLFSSLSEADIRTSNKFYNHFGQDYDLQNLSWSAELLENSYEQDLLDNISEKLMMDVPEAEKGGPLSFYYAMLEITSSTEDAIRTMETRLSSLKITSFQGENVSTACSQIRSAITRLLFLKKLPSNLTAKLLTVFQTSSVAAFNDIFRFLDLQRKIGSLVLTPTNLIDLANSSYRELIEKGEWNGNKKGEALLSFSDKGGRR